MYSPTSLLRKTFVQSFFVSTIRIGILVYVLFGLVLFLSQKNFIYYSDPVVFGECSDMRAGTEPLTLPNGARAYFTDVSSEKVAILYHGNAGSACDRALYTGIFELLGYSSLIVEYAGYGSDPRGGPSDEAILKDTEEFVTFVDEQGYSRVVLVGRSLGAAVASFHASQQPPDHLVLVTPFVSTLQLAQELYPLYPASLLLRERYDTLAWASAAAQTPVTIIHGTADTLVPIHHARELHTALPQENKELVELEGAEHNNLIGIDEYWEALERALQ